MNYFVTQRSQCPVCKGQKLVQPSIWRDYWSENGNRCLSDQEHFQWFSERGYSADDIPCEEVHCDNCDGAGQIEREVPLTEALRALGFQEKPAGAGEG